MSIQPIGKIVSIKKIQEISQKKNGKPLTAKQAKAVQVYAETGNKAEAGRQAYPTQLEGSQRQQGVETLAKPYVQNVLVELMDSKGLTDEFLIGELQMGIVLADVDKKKHDFLKTALQMKGHLKTTNINLSHTIKETRERFQLD